MLRNNVIQLFKHTSIYALGWLASMAASVLLLPVYTRYLSVEDYGAIDLIQQMNNIFRLLFIASFTYSVSRFFYDAESDAARRLTISTCATSVLLVASFAGLSCFVLRRELSQLLFGSAGYVNLVVVGSMIMVFDLAYVGLTYQYLVEKRSAAFVVLNLSKLISAIAANLFFIIGLELGGIGMLLGNLVSYLPVCLFALVSCARSYGLTLDRVLMFKLIKFGSPMVPAAVLATLMHSADRLMLSHLGTLEQVGMFAMGMQFPSMLNSALLTSFNSIWGGSVMFEISKQENGDYQIGKIATYYMTAFIVLQTALGVFSETIVRVLAAPKFMPAASIIPITCIGFTFHALYTFFTTKAFTAGTPKRMIAAYALPVLVKVLLTFLFVKTYGYMGSAWIMTVTYAVFAGSCYALFRTETTTKFEFGRLGALLAGCCFILMLTQGIHFTWLIPEILVRLALLLLLFTILWSAPYFDKNEKEKLVAELRKLLALGFRGARIRNGFAK